MQHIHRLAFVLASVLATSAHAAPIEPKVALDHSAVLAETKDTVYLLVELDVPESARPKSQRPSLNLAVVIDRSGSMQEAKKMSYAKSSARKLVDGLEAQDYFSVVVYDDETNVLWPATTAEAAKLAKRRIDRIIPGGSTDLYAGLALGIEQAKQHRADGRTTRVLLLSDGLANHGITNPLKIRDLARKARKTGVTVTALGLGADYNEDLMQAIAEHGGGRYHYVESPQQMARIFAEELSVLYTTVAKNVRVRFDQRPTVEKVEVISGPFESKGGRTTIAQEDLYAGEKRSVLLRITTRPEAEGLHTLGTLLVEYDDVEKKRPWAVEKEVRLQVTRDQAQVTASRDDRVDAESTLIEADYAQAEAVRAYEAGDEDEAEEKLTAISQKIQRKRRRIKDRRLAKKLGALQIESTSMARSKRDRAYKKRYLKRSKRRSYLGVKGKRGAYLLQEGDKGLFVERLQKALVQVGVYQGPINGTFGPDLRKAVETYQAQKGIEIDGLAGPDTLVLLGLY